MTAVTVEDLDNAKLDCDLIAEVATSTAMTAVDRLGHVKYTVLGAITTMTAFNPRGAWTTGTVYAIKDLVTDSGIAYVAVQAHTSTTISADLSAGKLAVYQGALMSDITAIRNDLASTAAGKGAAMVGFKQTGTGTITSTVNAKLHDMPTIVDVGGVADGTTELATQQAQAIANYGVCWLPPTLGSYKINGILMQGNAFISDESYPAQGTLRVDRTTSTNKDAIHARHFGTGVGYAVHGISSSTVGSGIGGASDGGQGIGTTGNKYGAGAGHGVTGNNIETGPGDGVRGERMSTGIGNGTSGINNTASASGSGVYGQRQNGGGSAIEGFKFGSGTGHAVNASNTSTSTGNGITGTRDSIGVGGPGGHAIEGIRTVGGSTVRGRGVIGNYDPVANAGIGVYAGAGANVNDLAAVLDGNSRCTAELTIGILVRPFADGGANCGHPSFRWGTVFAQTGTINTSDRNSKQQIGPIDERVMRAWAKVNFCQYKFNDAVAEKGADGARWHFGVVAQDIKEAFESEGLDATRYGLLCHDEWEDKFETIPAVTEYVDAILREEPPVIVDGKTIVPAQTIIERPAGLVEIEPAKSVQTAVAGSRYGVRYEEAMSLECAFLRWRLDGMGK